MFECHGAAHQEILRHERVIVQIDRQHAEPLLAAPRTSGDRAADDDERQARQNDTKADCHARFLGYGLRAPGRH